MGSVVAVQRRRGSAQVEHLVVGQRRHLGERGARRPSVRHVVVDDEVELVLDVAVRLVELEAEQAGLDAELDDHRLDLLGDAQHHLAALQHGGDVAQRHGVLQLGRREAEHGVLEAHLVALERLQRLVRPVEQTADVLQLVLRPAGVEVDDAHLLAGRDDGHLQRPGDALGGAMPGARFARRHRRVGDEVDVGPGDPVTVGGQDDRPVHLGQLGQPLRAERGVDEESSAADGEHLGIVVDDDQGAALGAHDAFDPRPQRACPERPSPARRAARH